MTLASTNSSQLHHLVSLMSRESDQMLQEQLGIGLSQYKILTTTHEHPHIQQKMIGQILGQTEASISRQVKLLKQKGMLQTVKNPNNLREHVTDLTPRGSRIIDAAEKVLASYHEKFFTGLSSKQQQQLAEVLGILHRSVCFMTHPGVADAD
jgi:DNA-binding MarR family transcriptional regulator